MQELQGHSNSETKDSKKRLKENISPRVFKSCYKSFVFIIILIAMFFEISIGTPDSLINKYGKKESRKNSITGLQDSQYPSQDPMDNIFVSTEEGLFKEDLYGLKNNKLFVNNLRQDTVNVPAKTENSSGLAIVTPKNHSETERWSTHLERNIMNQIEGKPINLIGEPTLINDCPHNCNNHGLCQKIYIKKKISENPDSYSYEAEFSCACKENFSGAHCQECAKGFFGRDCYSCPISPHDELICGIEGVCDDGIDGTGR
jgi:hypothetical protein